MYEFDGTVWRWICTDCLTVTSVQKHHYRYLMTNTGRQTRVGWVKHGYSFWPIREEREIRFSVSSWNVNTWIDSWCTSHQAARYRSKVGLRLCNVSARRYRLAITSLRRAWEMRPDHVTGRWYVVAMETSYWLQLQQQVLTRAKYDARCHAINLCYIIAPSYTNSTAYMQCLVHADCCSGNNNDLMQKKTT